MLLCNPPGVPLDGFVTPGFTWLSAAIAPSLWAQVQGSTGCGPQIWPTGVNAVNVPDSLLTDLLGDIAEVKSLLSQAFEHRETAAKAAKHGQMLALQVAQLARDQAILTQPAGGVLSHRIRLARRAEDWMRAHVQENVSVRDICHAMRVSRRELEYAFEACFDSSPKAFLQALRLNVVRQALRSAVPGRDSVTTIAVDHGINHLGRFAFRYRELFGELPSETLKNN
jgi:AraC-like DNA-binding protein